MANKTVLVIGAALLGGIMVHALGQTARSPQPAWLEPENPTRLEWLALYKQATEGDTDFLDGVAVNFYLGPDSARTGEILCDLEYFPGTTAEVIQIKENGILKRFENDRATRPWARVKIMKKVVRP